MLRLALWLVIIFIIWKAMRITVSIGRRSRETHAPNAPPFSNIEEAEKHISCRLIGHVAGRQEYVPLATRQCRERLWNGQILKEWK